MKVIAVPANFGGQLSIILSFTQAGPPLATAGACPDAVTDPIAVAGTGRRAVRAGVRARLRGRAGLSRVPARPAPTAPHGLAALLTRGR